MFAFDEPVSAVAETTDGGVLAATASGLVHVTPHDQRTLVAPLPRASADVRMNDWQGRPYNRFVGGTIARPARAGAPARCGHSAAAHRRSS